MAEEGEGFSFSPEPGPERAGDSFLDIQMALQFEELDQEGRRRLEEQRFQMVSAAAKAGLFKDASVSLSALLKGLEWDEVYSTLLSQADNLERSARRFYSHNPKWEGMVRTVVEGAAAKTVLGGIRKKASEEGRVTNDWLEKHGYLSRETVESLKKDAKENYLYPVVGQTPELLVASSTRHEEPRGEGRLENEDSLAEAFYRGQKRIIEETQLSVEDARELLWQSELKGELYRTDALNRVFVAEDHEGRRLLEIKNRILEAVVTKITAAFKAEDIIKNESLKSIKKSTVKYLYENMPGYRVALEKIVQGVKGRDKLFLKAKDQAQVERDLTRIIVQVKNSLVAGGMDDAEALLKAREASVLALNTHVAFNLFDSLESGWVFENGKPVRREGQPILKNTRLVSVPLRRAASPLNGLIDLAQQEARKQPEFAGLLYWAHTQMVEEAKKAGVKLNEDTVFSEVVLVGVKEWRKFWKMKKLADGTVRLFAPECRPAKLLKSAWESNKDDKNSQATLLDKLESSEDINWDSDNIAETFLLNYAVSAVYVGGLNDVFVKGAELGWGGMRAAKENLSLLGMSTNEELKGWIYYDLTGMYPRSKKPKRGSQTKPIHPADARIQRMALGGAYMKKPDYPWV
jgi:hypothetical protein